MRDLIGQRTINAKFKHVYQKFFLLFCYHRFHDKHNRITTSKEKGPFLVKSYVANQSYFAASARYIEISAVCTAPDDRHVKI